uniref:Gamma interferon inducible lysosomal thiol reductase n=1 Tax=Rhabditophanes sp. KR3021 TaxID=114890 RepID=A0AC35TSW7_9BILA
MKQFSANTLSLLFLLSIISIAYGQQVNVTIFVESQCPYCTKLMREQLWPFHVTRPGIMNLQIVPYGKGQCTSNQQGSLFCTCQHGQNECDLNRLQNCAISYFPRRHLGLVTCIQGLTNLNEAFSRCLSRLSPPTQQRLMTCATTQIGETLNYYSMVNTHRAQVSLWPTAYVNGQFFDRSYPISNKICENTNWC